MIDLEQGRPEVSRGDLIVFEDGTDQPPSFLVYEICKDRGDRPVFRGLWNSDLGQMGAVLRGYAEVLTADMLRQHFLTQATDKWTREENILRVWR